MRYYVVEILKIKDGGEDRPQPAGFDDLDSALKRYHQILAQDIQGEVVEWVTCMVINEYGKIEVVERWESKTNTSEE